MKTAHTTLPNFAEPVEDELGVPTVKLDAHAITDVLAARLAICLLGHVLYLKSQVPLCVVLTARLQVWMMFIILIHRHSPVMQLSRMPMNTVSPLYLGFAACS